MELIIGNIVLTLVEGIILCNTGSIRGKKIYLFLVFVQLFILHAFLDPFTMEDLPGYCNTYSYFGENPFLYSTTVGYVGVKMEPGWIFLCKCLYFLSHDYRLLLIVDSLIIVGCYIITIKRYSVIAYISVFLFLCTTFNQSLFVLRQHTAMAICLLTVPYIIERKLKYFLLLVLIASSIHQTAIIFLPIYFAYHFNLNKYFWIYYIIILLVGSIIAPQIFSWAFSNLWYSSYEDREGANLTLFFIQLCGFILYLFSIGFKTKEIKTIEKVFVIMACFGLLLSFIGVGFSPTNRLVKYFTISEIWLIPFAIKKFNSFRVVIVIIIIVMYFMLFMSPSTTDFIKNYRLVI